MLYQYWLIKTIVIILESYYILFKKMNRMYDYLSLGTWNISYFSHKTTGFDHVTTAILVWDHVFLPLYLFLLFIFVKHFTFLFQYLRLKLNVDLYKNSSIWFFFGFFFFAFKLYIYVTQLSYVLICHYSVTGPFLIILVIRLNEISFQFSVTAIS